MSGTITHPSGCFDNTARDYRTIQAVPLAAAMGVEIRGVRFADATDDQFAEIRDALFRHKMVFAREQAMTHADQESFSLRFGVFAPDAYTKGVPEHPDVQPVIREADQRDRMIFGSGWHTDSPFLPCPPSITMLRGVDIPPFGGDTIWANSALALATLSPTMQQLLAGLRVRMSMRRVLATAQSEVTPSATPLGRLAATRDAAQLEPDLARKVEGSAHPLVRTHPVTGERALYCDGTYAVAIEGMTDAESDALLRFLLDHLVQDAFTCRLRWESGTVVMWDNRLCVHQAFNDYDGYRREMYRTTIAGEVPI